MTNTYKLNDVDAMLNYIDRMYDADDGAWLLGMTGAEWVTQLDIMISDLNPVFMLAGDGVEIARNKFEAFANERAKECEWELNHVEYPFFEEV